MFDKLYGTHNYKDKFLSRIHCSNGCGCFVGKYKSGGPVGIDPSANGTCPRNPLNGLLLNENGKADYRYVVNQKIWILKEQSKKYKSGINKLARILIKKNEQRTEQLKAIVNLKKDIAHLKIGEPNDCALSKEQ